MRLLPLAGVVFAVLGVANVALTNIPDLGDSPATTAAFYASASHRHKEVAAAYVGVAAALAFVVFLYSIVIRVRERRPDLGTLCLVAGGAFAAVTIAAHATFLAPTASVSLGYSSAKTVDPDFAREASTLADAILFGGVALGGLAAIAAAIALGGWLRWFGYAAGAVTVIGTFTFFPLLVLPLWAAVTGIALTLQPAARATGEATGREATPA